MSWLLASAAIAVLWFSARYAWWRPALDWNRPRILMYHMVGEHRPGAKFNGLRVPPAMFERQLAWLVQQGFTFMTMAELLQAGERVPPRTVVLTFDDGYQDNYTNAFPLMRRYGAKGTLYLVVDRHDRDWSTYKKAHHDSGELAREPKLTDAQVREMVESGVFELGAHTLTHANLAALDDAGKRMEMRQAREQLEQSFGVPVTSFAYPFGIFDAQDARIARECGYTNAVTTVDGVDPLPFPDPMRIARVKAAGKDNFLAFRLRITGGKRGWRK